MLFRVLFDILLARRTIVLVTALCCMAGGGYVAATFQPRYQATARVVLDYIKPDPITGTYVNSKQADQYTRTQMQLVRDAQTAALAAEALGLLDNIDLQTQYAATGGSAGDFGRWIGRRIITATGVRPIPDSNMIEISYAAPNREAALAYVEAIRMAYLRALVRNKQSGASQSASLLALQAEKVGQQLADLEAARRALQDRGGDIPTYEATKLAELVRTVNGQYVEQAKLAPSGQRLAEVEAELDTASRELGPNHPKIAELKIARDMLKGQTAREAQAAAAVGSSAALAERARQAELEATKNRVLAGRLTALEMRLVSEEIERRGDVLRSHNAKIAELRSMSSIQNAGATALGEPEAENYPVFPDATLILVGTGIIGLAAGSLLAILVELLNRRVRRADDLAQAVGAPVLGQAPARRAEGRGGLKALGRAMRYVPIHRRPKKAAA